MIELCVRVAEGDDDGEGELDGREGEECVRRGSRGSTIAARPIPITSA